MKTVLPDLDEVGVIWDEPNAHFTGSDWVREWLKESGKKIAAGDLPGVFDREFLHRYWPPSTPYSQNHVGPNDHPPMARYLPALSWTLFHQWTGDVAGYRLSSAIQFSALVAGVFICMARHAGIPAGLFSALSLMAMPRVLGHAHIAATDMPLATFWFFAMFAFYRVLTGEGRSATFAVSLGLLFLVKFSGFLLPAGIALYALASRDRRIWRAVLPALWLSPLLLWMLNPTWWRDPLETFYQNFFQLYFHREDFTPIPGYYFGQTYSFNLPWHHALVLTLLTVPPSILVLAGLGIGLNIRNALRPGLESLLLWLVIWYYFIMALPFVPNHDGVRLFLPLFPLLACFAGLGFQALCAWLRLKMAGRLGTAVAGYLLPAFALVVFLLPCAIQIASVRPYYLEYFNSLAGGVWGARRLGFETTYWLDTVTREVRNVISRLPDGSTIEPFPASPSYFRFLQRRGLLNPSLVFKRGQADYYLLVPRQGKFDSVAWNIYEHARPIYAAELDGVPMVLLYKVTP